MFFFTLARSRNNMCLHMGYIYFPVAILRHWFSLIKKTTETLTRQGYSYLSSNSYIPYWVRVSGDLFN